MVIKKDYLPWLTARLERMALHIKIKTWLQDSGYPLGGRGKADKSPREPRKQDFSLRLFEAYCDSEEGYDFYKKDLSGQENCGDWHMDGQGLKGLRGCRGNITISRQPLGQKQSRESQVSIQIAEYELHHIDCQRPLLFRPAIQQLP